MEYPIHDNRGRKVYRGGFNGNNECTGKGSLEFTSGMSYEGEFLDNYCHGTGIIKSENAVLYTGTWNKGHLTHRLPC